jgi:hypothetical protein
VTIIIRMIAGLLALSERLRRKPVRPTSSDRPDPDNADREDVYPLW